MFFLDENQQLILDQNKTPLAKFHDKIYLNIQSSINAEEFVRRVNKMNLSADQTSMFFLYMKEESLFMVKSNL